VSEQRRPLKRRERWALAVRHSESRDVIKASEIVLAGEYLEHLRLYHRLVPVWAWTNVLAHGSEAQLERASRSWAADNADGVDRWTFWMAARSMAAAEVLDVARRKRSLTELQAEVLVPLELRLFDSAVTERWGPRRWLDEVITSIDPNRQSPHGHIELP
jgi:hypothetical protein